MCSSQVLVVRKNSISNPYYDSLTKIVFLRKVKIHLTVVNHSFRAKF